MTIDLTGVEAAALQLAGIVLIAVLSMVGRAVLARLNLQLTAAQRGELDDIAKRALSAAYTTTIASAKSAGWDHVQIKNDVLGHAVLYAIQRFPDAMKRAGIDPTDPVAAGDKLAGLLTRLYSPIAAETAGIHLLATSRTEEIRTRVGLTTGENKLIPQTSASVASTAQASKVVAGGFPFTA